MSAMGDGFSEQGAKKHTMMELNKYSDLLKKIRDIIDTIPLFPVSKESENENHYRVVREIHELLEDNGM